MTCITASVTLFRLALLAKVAAKSRMLACASLASSPMSAKALAARADMHAKATAKLSPLQVTTALVCSVGDMHYIYVSPTTTQWISETDTAIYLVESDTKWRIE